MAKVISMSSLICRKNIASYKSVEYLTFTKYLYHIHNCFSHFRLSIPSCFNLVDRSEDPDDITPCWHPLKTFKEFSVELLDQSCYSLNKGLLEWTVASVDFHTMWAVNVQRMCHSAGNLIRSSLWLMGFWLCCWNIFVHLCGVSVNFLTTPCIIII